MKNNIELSCIVPVYNAESYILRTINSIKNMIGNFGEQCEILFIDDGSQDDTIKIIRREITSYPNMHILQKKHSGVSDTRNYGIKHAKGKYITFLDSDDCFKSNFADNILRLSNYGVDIIFFDIELINEEYEMYNLSNLERLNLLKMVIRGRGNTGINSKIYRKAFLETNNIFFQSDIIVSEDALFLMQAIDKAESVYLSNEKFYYVLQSHTLQYYNEKLLDSELNFHYNFDLLLKKYQNINPDTYTYIKNKIFIMGFILLVERYFTPLVAIRKKKLKEACQELKDIANYYRYNQSFSDNRFDSVFSKRYKLYRFLFKKGKYKISIILGLFLDKINNNIRFK